MVKSSTVTEIALRVSESTGKDVGRGIARIDPADMQRIGLDVGDMLEVEGKRRTVCRAMPTFKEHRRMEHLQIDGVIRENAGVGLGEMAVVRRASVKPAEELVLLSQGAAPQGRDLKYIGGLLDGLPATAGDRVRVTLFGNRRADFLVKSTSPAGPVTVMSDTLLKLQSGEAQPATAAAPLSYEDIGGLRRQLDRVREIVELPLRYPELFERLGIDAPKGVLLYGPPGCGKTLLARAVAHETEAKFFSINGPEIIHKFYGESEAHLRKLFEEAARQAPSILFLDEIDAIAPRRERVVGDVEKRVVAQLLALMDGLSQRQHVIVLAATNLPNALDPALRRPGRFDREISIPIPDQHGRREILEIHSRGMPLDPEVDLAHVAAITHGFVGADLEALCREAGMNALRRLLPAIDFSQPYVPDEMLARLQVAKDDFREALREVEPSAVREVFVEVPNVTWNDVGGLDEIKARLREAVEWPLAHPELFQSVHLTPPKGALVSGPPGCGKTLIAKALATEAGVNFVSVKGPELLSMYVGESERGLRDVFRKARQAAPCIIFFDEIDALASARSGGGNDSGVAARVLSQLLTELDGIEELKGVFVLAATNRPDLLDPALLRPGRFDLCLEIPPPDRASREKIFQIHLRDRPVEPAATAAWLAGETEGFTGAQIEGTCRRAAMATIAAHLAASPGQPPAGTLVIGRDALQAAVKEMRDRPQ
ncbi:MAG: CDC48 family AAA ATPase [Thermoguttaceae bacterium]|jgi:transitional endoplasmic reticulum ATPase